MRIDYLVSQIPSVDDYLIDADRSTLRLSTGYRYATWAEPQVSFFKGLLSKKHILFSL